MQLDKNLYQDKEHKHWHLEFKGEELKVSERRGRENEFHINITDYCPDIVEHLQEYLTKHRPLLNELVASFVNLYE